MGIEHQLQRYIVYTCKKCKWQTAIVDQWADLKPKKCMNKKCGCYFLKEPDMLDIKKPESKKKDSKKVSKKKKVVKKKKKDE